jgi:hypothetical protein
LKGPSDGELFDYAEFEKKAIIGLKEGAFRRFLRRFGKTDSAFGECGAIRRDKRTPEGRTGAGRNPNASSWMVNGAIPWLAQTLNGEDTSGRAHPSISE